MTIVIAFARLHSVLSWQQQGCYVIVEINDLYCICHKRAQEQRFWLMPDAPNLQLQSVSRLVAAMQNYCRACLSRDIIIKTHRSSARVPEELARKPSAKLRKCVSAAVN